MSKTNPAPQAPTAPTITTVANTASDTLGDGNGGRYLFTTAPTAAHVVGTADQQDVTLWITFSAPNGTPATPVAGTAGWPIRLYGEREFTLGDGVKFKAIADTTSVLLVWQRVSDE